MKQKARYRKSTASGRGKEKVDVDERRRGKKKRTLCDIESESASEECTQGSDIDSKFGLGSLLYANSAEDKSGSEGERHIKRQRNDTGRAEVIAKGKYDQTSYRSNIQSAIKDLKGLNFQRSHIKAIKRTPFWLFFNAIYNSDVSKLKKRCDKDEKSIKQIILCYDDLQDRFQLGGRIVKLRRRDVQLVLGVISGTKPLATNSSKSEDPAWIIRCFENEMARGKGKMTMYKSHLLNKMKELLGNGEGRELDMARLAHCYLLAAVLAPNKNASMPSNVTRCLEDFAGICDYDWCSYIIEMLKNQIGGSTSSRAGGCTILLPYWLCEHVKIVKPINKVAFPRFLRWNLRDVNKVLARTDISDLDPDDVFVDDLEATNVEKETIRNLLDYWKIENKRPQKENYLATPKRRRTAPRAAPKLASVSDDDFVDTVPIGLQTTPARGGVKRVRGRGNISNSSGPSSSKNEGDTPQNDRYFQQSEARVHAPTTERCSVNENSEFEMSVPHLSDPHDMPFGVNDRTGVEGSNEASHHGVSNDDFNADVQLALGYCLSEGVDNKTLSLEVSFLKEKIGEKERILLEKEKVIWEMGKDMDNLKEQLAVARAREEELETLRVNFEICKADAQKMRSYLGKKLWNDQADQIANPELQLSKGGEGISQLRPVLGELSNSTNSCDQSKQNVSHDLDMQKNDVDIGSCNDQLDKELTPPTYTQILESPESLARIDDLERLHYEKVGEKPLNSMIKRVKERTANDDRKAIELTPPPSTNEILVLDSKAARPGVIGKMRWDKKCDAVKKTKPEIKDVIVDLWGKEGGCSVAWEGKGSVNRIYLSDVLLVLHHERLSGPVIDCWAELLLGLAKGKENAARTVVFNGNCWELIAKVNSTPKGLVDMYVNEPLDKVGTDNILIFPMLAISLPTAPARLGDHWTLLKLDLKEGGWTFLNPRCPRTSDPHLAASYIVIEYVESRLRDRFRALEPRHLLVKRALGRPVPMPSVQQSVGSLDCGVVICYHIENEIFKRKSERGVMSMGICGNYRKRMIEWLLQPAKIPVDDVAAPDSGGSSRG